MAAAAAPTRFDKPLQLVTREGKDWKPVEATLKAISAITNSVVVIFVIGEYRTGKSFLLNLLADKQHLFETSPEGHGTTKGLLVWPMRLPTSEHTILLVDTQGMCDTDNYTEDKDRELFLMSLLLSSLMIVNVRLVIDANVLATLAFAAELTSDLVECPVVDTTNADVKSAGNMAHLAALAPDLLMLVRDADTDLRGRTEDEYLEDCLVESFAEEKAATVGSVQRREVMKRRIKMIFCRRFCRRCPLPGAESAKQMDANWDCTSVEFRQRMRLLRKEIFERAPTKKITVRDMQIELTGAAFAKYVPEIVERVNKIKTKTKLNIQSSSEAMYQFERQAAMNEACAVWRTGMKSFEKTFPVSMKELYDKHWSLSKTAIEILESKPLLAHDASFVEEFNNKVAEWVGASVIAGELKEFVTTNWEVSRQLCDVTLRDLLLQQDIEKRVKRGDFAGNLLGFQTEMDAIISRFHSRVKGPAVPVFESDFANKRFEWGTVIQNQRARKPKDEKALYDQEVHRLQTQLDQVSSMFTEAVENRNLAIQQQLDIQAKTIKGAMKNMDDNYKRLAGDLNAALGLVKNDEGMEALINDEVAAAAVMLATGTQDAELRTKERAARAQQMMSASQEKAQADQKKFEQEKLTLEEQLKKEPQGFIFKTLHLLGGFARTFIQGFFSTSFESAEREKDGAARVAKAMSKAAPAPTAAELPRDMYDT